MIPRYARPDAVAIWSPETRYKIWFEIEAHAADAMAELGTIPKAAAEAIWAGGKDAVWDPDRIDEIERVTKHDVIAFLTHVSEVVGPEARFLHQGMTSSDVLDTCLSVQMCRATDLLLEDVDLVLAALKQYPLPGRYRAGARRRGHHRLAFQAMHGDGPGTLCDGRPWPARSTRRINCRAGVLIWRVVTASRSVAPSGRTSMVLSGLACCSAIAASGATGDQRRHRAGLGGGREHRCCVAALPMHAGLRPRLKEVTEAGQCTSAGCAP